MIFISFPYLILQFVSGSRWSRHHGADLYFSCRSKEIMQDPWLQFRGETEQDRFGQMFIVGANSPSIPRPSSHLQSSAVNVVPEEMKLYNPKALNLDRRAMLRRRCPASHSHGFPVFLHVTACYCGKPLSKCRFYMSIGVKGALANNQTTDDKIKDRCGTWDRSIRIIANPIDGVSYVSVYSRIFIDSLSEWQAACGNIRVNK